MDNDNTVGEAVATGISLVGEYVIPGGSNLIKGDIKQAGLHAVLGVAAGMAFGPLGILLVKANSFSKARTGRHLVEHFSGDTDTDTEPEPVGYTPPPKAPKTAS
jgi:hypothetical protein